MKLTRLGTAAAEGTRTSAVCVILQAEYHATLFAYGEFYCYAVLFGLRRVIFASQV